ncbi:histone chaperone asf1 [Exophiala viscosa]|uniref:Histone chaperone n=1 Tax=Exophiala viscosa TaxID=2486360 RepID=A0AAN6E4E2_9EURO|nr:histone chaperone asf1 [Exophiala viscosa]KAI1626896.1 histone chaperone asf1 [Exophiala viscosa]
MSVVSLLGVKILNNPAPFTAPYEFEITFECLEQLREDLEWKLTYVGSATSAEHDQELDSLLVGPIPIGVNKFIFEADPPKLSRLPSSEIIGVTVILLTCSYDGREFVRVGYYVNNEYDSEELQNDPPSKPIIERVRRNILAEKPRVTRFAIKWDSEESAPAEYPPDQPEADTLDDDGTAYGAEEADMQAALEKELEDTDAAAKKAPVSGKQEPVVAKQEKEEDEESEAGSEDLEEESSESDEDEEDEEAAEGEDTEMAEADEKPATSTTATSGEQKTEAQPEVMVH